MNPNLPVGGVNLQPQQRGKLFISLQFAGSYVHVWHGVDPVDFELDPKTGRAKPVQADKHLVDIFLMNVDLNARLGLTEWFSVSLQLPLRLAQTWATFEDAQGQRLEDFQSIHHRTETLFGLAAPYLQAQFRILQPALHKGWLLEFGIGLTFPTGGTEEDPFRLGKEGKQHQHIFFGSGTFDPTVQATVAYALKYVRLQLWSSLRISLYENIHRYKAGTKWTTGLGADTGFGLQHWRFLFQAEVYHQTPDTWGGTEDFERSGRTDLIAVLGVFWQLSTYWQLQLLVKFPITLRTEGAQLSIPVLGILGVTSTIPLF